MRSGERGRRDQPGIEVAAEGDAVVVRLSGELDISTTRPVRQAMLELARRATGWVVVDLAEVEFMDSTALGILVETRAHLRDGKRLLLAAPGLEVRRALEVSGLDRAFTVHPTVAEALAATA